MAKRNKPNNGASYAVLAILVLGIISLSISTAALIMPAVLILGRLVNSSDRRKFNSQSALFTQTSPKKGDASKRQRNLKIYQQLLQRIEQEGQGLPRRKDGFFSERSDLGKNLNEKLEKIQQRIENEEQIIEHIDLNPAAHLAEQQRLERMRKLYNGSIWFYLIALAGLSTSLDLLISLLLSGGLTAFILIMGLWLYTPPRQNEAAPKRHSEIHQ